MFRRSRSGSPPPVEVGNGDLAPDPTAPKGRPTPKRREAEAAARARAKARAGKSARRDRAGRAAESRRIRQGIKEGDERYLPARDRGPLRRFVRDFVDARLSMAEAAIPLMATSLLLSMFVDRNAGNAVLNATILVVVLDSLLLRFRLRRELKRRFPGESLRGTTFYAFVRSLQLRFMRLPKPRVKLGQTLPGRY